MLTRVVSTGLALAGATATAAALLTDAALRPQSQLFGRTLIAGPDPNEVVLTYDDGPNQPATERLLNLLDREHARAAFFMIGRFARQHAGIVRAVHAAGHVIGNHTETHPWLTTQPLHRIREELRACNQTLEDTLGQQVRFLRPPHGARRPAVFKAARELGLTVVQWNAMGYDWQPIGVEDILRHVDRGLRRAKRSGRGANILLHDGWDVQFGADRSNTVSATAALLERFRIEGRRVTTLDQIEAQA